MPEKDGEIVWIDRVKSEEVLRRIKEEGNIIHNNKTKEGSEIIWNANLLKRGNFIDVLMYTRPTERLSRPPPNQEIGAENHMLQLNI